MAYATREHVYLLGLTAQAFTPRARRVEAVDASANVLTVTGHGFVVNPDYPRALTFVLESPGNAVLGVSSPSLPGGLSASTVYYPSPVNGSGDLFTVATLIGGATVDITSAGSGQLAIRVDPGPTLDALLEDDASRINNAMTGVKGPIPSNPTQSAYKYLRGLNARMTARRAQVVLGLANPEQHKAAIEALDEMRESDERDLENMLAGRPPWPSIDDLTPSIPENGARAGRDRAPTCWRTGYL